MKLLKLPVLPRDKTGRGPARRFRAAGLIPAVVYGKSGVRHLTVKEPDFRLMMRAVAGTAALVEITDAAGAPTLSLLQEIQRDARTDKFVHIDLKEVSPNEQMRASVPVRIHGESIGVKLEGGIVEINRYALDIKCLPKDLPDFVSIDVSELHAGDSVHVRDIKPIPGVIFDMSADEVVAACVIPAVEEEPVAADAVPVEGEAAVAGAEGAAAPGAEGAAAGAKGAAPAAGAKGAAPAAGAKGAAPAAGAKGAAPAAGAKGAAPAGGAKGAAPAAKPGKK